MQKGSSTTNTVLIILLVIVVGLVVWYFTSHKSTNGSQDNSAGLQINLGASNSNSSY